MIYQNYHRHSRYTNVRVPDSVATNEDYAKRAKELGHGIISTMEHGFQGRYIEGYELAKQYDLKFLFGTEAYWVKDRLEKDNTNAHICLFARNENGRQAINDILAEANISGFYYQPRIDLSLLLSLPKDDVWVTSACIGFWKYKDDDIVKQLYDYFRHNFYLEVQYHNTQSQYDLNKHIIDLSNRYNIPLIMGCDSHYISMDTAWERDDYIKSKGIVYEDEAGWFLDYADGQTAYNRFIEQGVLTKAKIQEAMNNTNVFLEVEEYNNPCFTKEIKMPSLYPNLTQEEKDKKYVDLIWEKWNEEKSKIPQEKPKLYEEEIQKEIDAVITTKHADYFLFDYELVKESVKKGGMITPSGRGSAVSYYTNKLLGFTKVDRIASEVKMYPERFISPTRILESKSLADLDLNFGNPEVPAIVQKEILGEECAYPMVAYGTMKAKAAWKMYAKANEVDFELANQVSEQIEKYEDALKHAEEDEEIDLFEYVDEKYHVLLKDSEKYLGVISDYKVHPCGHLLYQGNIRKEIGLIKSKSKSSNKEALCALMDGKWAEDYKFMKNDLLKVSVVEIIYRTYQRIGQELHDVPDLIKLCRGNDKVWNIYKSGYVIGINQVEQSGTKHRVMKYEPKNISELCAFIAAIRPGFKSMYKIFADRQKFEYDIPVFDKLIQTPEMPSSFVLYQEMAMAALNFAGVPMSECYEIIKSISKKRVEKIKSYKDMFLNGMASKIIEHENKTQGEAIGIANDIWQIIEDSSQYSFNACVSGDTKIQRAGMTKSRFEPTIEEMYFIKNSYTYAQKTGHIPLHEKYNTSIRYGNALSMFDDGRVRTNNIVDIRQSGIRKIYRITTDTGEYIDCTMNHKFPTPQGEKKLEELKISDELFTIAKYEKTPDKYRLTDGNFESNLPQKGQRGFQKKPQGNSVLFNALAKEKTDSECCCELCNIKYDKASKFELHHKDSDRTNNQSSNLQWLCNSCHKKEHYKIGRTKTYEKGIPIKVSKIISIEYLKEEMTYDIEMKAPAHNFISKSGLVASNSHSYCVSIDSLYGAYLKSHYPLEFYETFLRIMDEKGNKKERMKDAQKEAEAGFRIRFAPFRFRDDNRNIVAIPETNTITNTLKSIKSFGSKIADQLYSLKDNEYATFIDLLIDMEEKSILCSKIEHLIKIKYFDEFGGNKKLLNLYNEFISGKSRYDKKHKDATKEKRTVELKLIEQSATNEELPMEEQIKTDNEILGYVQMTYNVDKRYVFLMDVNTKFSPRIEAYCLANGKTESMKIAKKTYNNIPVQTGDIIFIEKCTPKPQKKFENGKFIDVEGTKEWWVDKYYKANEKFAN